MDSSTEMCTKCRKWREVEEEAAKKARGTNVKCAENDGSRITKQPGTVKFMSHTYTHRIWNNMPRAIAIVEFDVARGTENGASESERETEIDDSNDFIKSIKM